MEATPRPAAFFDLDGTLIDSFGDIARSARFALREHHFAEPDDRAVRAAVGRGIRHLLAVLIPGASETTKDSVERCFRAHYRANLVVDTAPYPGVVSLLEELRDRGATLVLVTNKPEVMARAIVEALALDPFFAALVGGDSAAKKKPASEALTLARSRAETRVGPILPRIFVGDGPADLGAARTLGVPFLGVSWGHTPPGAWTDLEPGDTLAHAVPDLREPLLHTLFEAP